MEGERHSGSVSKEETEGHFPASRQRQQRQVARSALPARPSPPPACLSLPKTAANAAAAATAAATPAAAARSTCETVSLFRAGEAGGTHPAAAAVAPASPTGIVKDIRDERLDMDAGGENLFLVESEGDCLLEAELFPGASAKADLREKHAEDGAAHPQQNAAAVGTRQHPSEPLAAAAAAEGNSRATQECSSKKIHCLIALQATAWRQVCGGSSMGDAYLLLHQRLEKRLLALGALCRRKPAAAAAGAATKRRRQEEDREFIYQMKRFISRAPEQQQQTTLPTAEQTAKVTAATAVEAVTATARTATATAGTATTTVETTTVETATTTVETATTTVETAAEAPADHSTEPTEKEETVERGHAADLRGIVVDSLKRAAAELEDAGGSECSETVKEESEKEEEGELILRPSSLQQIIEEGQKNEHRAFQRGWFSCSRSRKPLGLPPQRYFRAAGSGVAAVSLTAARRGGGGSVWSSSSTTSAEDSVLDLLLSKVAAAATAASAASAPSVAAAAALSLNGCKSAVRVATATDAAAAVGNTSSETETRPAEGVSPAGGLGPSELPCRPVSAPAVKRETKEEKKKEKKSVAHSAAAAERMGMSPETAATATEVAAETRPAAEAVFSSETAEAKASLSNVAAVKSEEVLSVSFFKVSVSAATKVFDEEESKKGNDKAKRKEGPHTEEEQEEGQDGGGCCWDEKEEKKEVIVVPAADGIFFLTVAELEAHDRFVAALHQVRQTICYFCGRLSCPRSADGRISCPESRCEHCYEKGHRSCSKADAMRSPFYHLVDTRFQLRYRFGFAEESAFDQQQQRQQAATPFFPLDLQEIICTRCRQRGHFVCGRPPAHKGYASLAARMCVSPHETRAKQNVIPDYVWSLEEAAAFYAKLPDHVRRCYEEESSSSTSSWHASSNRRKESMRLRPPSPPPLPHYHTAHSAAAAAARPYQPAHLPPLPDTFIYHPAAYDQGRHHLPHPPSLPIEHAAAPPPNVFRYSSPIERNIYISALPPTAAAAGRPRPPYRTYAGEAPPLTAAASAAAVGTGDCYARSIITIQETAQHSSRYEMTSTLDARAAARDSTLQQQQQQRIISSRRCGPSSIYEQQQQHEHIVIRSGGHWEETFQQQCHSASSLRPAIRKNEKDSSDRWRVVCPSPQGYEENESIRAYRRENAPLLLPAPRRTREYDCLSQQQQRTARDNSHIAASVRTPIAPAAAAAAALELPVRDGNRYALSSPPLQHAQGRPPPTAASKRYAEERQIANRYAGASPPRFFPTHGAGDSSSRRHRPILLRSVLPCDGGRRPAYDTPAAAAEEQQQQHWRHRRRMYVDNEAPQPHFLNAPVVGTPSYTSHSLYGDQQQTAAAAGAHCSSTYHSRDAAPLHYACPTVDNHLQQYHPFNVNTTLARGDRQDPYTLRNARVPPDRDMSAVSWHHRI